MGSDASKIPEVAVQAEAPKVEGEKKKCKACCACPETKRARDDCIVQYGQENCKELIEAHRKCMKAMGFDI